MKAGLWIVPTPLGDPEDLSIRARRVLDEVDGIACEDPDWTAELLRAIDVAHRDRLVRYREVDPGPILEDLRAGASVALVCDAGTPALSDPGSALVRAAVDAGIAVYPLPGPCAATTALSASGLSGARFLSLGFPPRHPGKLRRLLASVADRPETLVLYAQHVQVAAVLRLAREVLGDRPACLASELARPGERLWHGTVGSLRVELSDGDHVLVVAGSAP